MVLQETWLKKGTIRDNIIMGKPDATDEEIRQCIDTCMDTLAHDGGYIISDSNSVPASVNPDNIVKISEYIQNARCVYAADGYTQQ